MTDSLNRVPVPQLIEYAPQVIAEPDTGFGEAFGAARDLTSTARAGAGILDESAFEYDPEWSLDVEGYLAETDPQYHGALRTVMPTARSRQHMDWLRDRTMEEVDAMQAVGEYTNGSILGNLGIFMGASLTDPLTLGANVVAGAGALRTVVNGVRLTRLQRAMRGAAFEGTVNAGLESILAAGNPTSTIEDVLIAGFAGAAFGAGLGAIGRGYTPGTISETTNAGLTRVGDDALNAQAAKDAAAVRGEAAAEVTPPAEWTPVQPPKAAEKVTVKPYEARDEALRSKEEVEAKLAELNAQKLPDEPVAPRTREDLEGFREELAFYKKLPEMKLPAKEATRAKIEFNRAKSAFMEQYRDADPEGFQTVFGNRDRLNPPNEELEAKLPEIEKRMAKLEQRFEKDQLTYKTAVDELGTRKDELLSKLDELNAVIKEPPRSVGAAEAEDAVVSGGGDVLGPKFYADDTLFEELPEMRHGLMWGERQVPGFSRMRVDLASWTDHSSNDLVRRTGRKLFQDANTKKDHATNPMTATEESAKVQEGLMGLYQGVIAQQFPKWLEAQGTKWGRGKDLLDWDGKAVRIFHEEVIDAVEQGGHMSPEVAKAAEAWKEAMSRAKEYWEESGMPGAGTFPTDPNYIPRRVSDNSLTELNAHYEVPKAALSPGIKGGLAEMYYRALMGANPTFDPKRTAMIANHIGQNQLKRVGRIGVHSVADLGRMTRETLEDFLEEMNVPESARRDFYDMLDLESTKEDAGRIGPAKRRLNLKMDHEPIPMEYTGPATATLKPGDIVERQLGDIMERNADLLLTGYANQMVGWGAIHRYFPGKIYNQSSLDSYLDNIRKFEMDVVKDPNRMSNKVMGWASPLEADIKRLTLGFRDALGHSMVDDPHAGQAALRRALTGWGVSRLMGQTFFPQASEASKVLSASSLKTVMHHMPIAKQYMDALRTGKPLTKDMAIMHQMALDYGIGTNFARGGAPNRYSTDMDGALFTKQDKWAHRLNKAKSITTAPLRVAMDIQELVAAKSLQTDIAAAFRAGSVDEAMGKRLRFMGISKGMETRIRKQVLKHAQDEKGGLYANSSSEFVGDFNLNAWDDPKARDVWELGMKRRVGEIVQSNNVGNLPGWVFTDPGQMGTQFRTFTMAAFPKQLLNTMSYGDLQAVYTLMLNSLFSATAYTAQKSLSSIGRDDADEYRKRYITPEKIAMAAWERSAWATFTPIAGDILSYMTTGEAMSPYSSRSTGLQYGVKGIPAFDLVDSVPEAFNSVFGAMHGNNSARDAYDDVRQLLFFQNLIGVQNVLNGIGNLIPD